MLADSVLQNATDVLRAGGVIAYPTEFCFGLGCDPRNESAMDKLLRIKRRDKAQGVILIAGEVAQISAYTDLSALPKKAQILASWPGANTWLMPALASTPYWVRGEHSSVAMRIPDHALCRALCLNFGHPIVSTSANRHGQAAHLNANSVSEDFGDELDVIIDAPVGGASSASTIRDAISGQTLR